MAHVATKKGFVMAHALRLVSSVDGSSVVNMVGRGRGKANRKSSCGSFTVGKGWRKTIGMKADGKPTRFWLGFDEREATIKAMRIEAIWLLNNDATWSHDALADAEAVRRSPIMTNAAQVSQAAIQAAPMLPSVPKVPSSAMTLAAAIVRYCDDLNNRSVSNAHKASVRHRLSMLSRSHGSIALASLDSVMLSKMVGDRLKKSDAQNIIRTTKALLRWLDDEGIWEAPRRFDRIFAIGRKQSAAPRVLTFPIEHLAKMYAAASARYRLWILLGLNCGFANMELATLRRSEIDLTNGYIERKRTKTQVNGRWKLWKETIEALKPYCKAKGNSDRVVLTSDDGNPLVWFSSNNRRTDSVCQCWTRFTKRAKVNHLGFKHLRKTGATMIRAIDGIEVSEQYLAHAEKGIARFYSVPDASRLDKALVELRVRLSQMFVSIG